MGDNALRDRLSHQKQSQALAPGAPVTASVDGASVDMQGYNSYSCFANVGAEGDVLSAVIRIELALEESDDDITFTPVADVDMIEYVAGQQAGTFAVLDDPAEAPKAYKGGYRGHKRYVQPVVVLFGVHATGTVVGIVSVREGARLVPVEDT